MIGCRCDVCTSDEARNRRLRCGLALEAESRTVLIDTPTDLRQQALAFGVERVDAVVYTHAHADHTFGIDELRIFNFLQRETIAVYGNTLALERIRQTFSYIFEDGQEGGGKPRIELYEIAGPFRAAGLELTPVPVWHGSLEVLGYRLGDFAYVTDRNRIPEDSFRLLTGVDTLILDALRFEPPHPTHFTVAEAVATAARIGARRTYLTHLNHDVDYNNPKFPLPDGVELAYDGLQFEIA